MPSIWAEVGQSLAAARRLSRHFGLPLEVFDLSSLRNNFLGLANGDQIALSLSGSPSMNCPFGILGLAATYAVACGASGLITGVHRDDICRSPHAKKYIANVGQDAALLHQMEFDIHTPILEMSKADAFRLGRRLEVPFELTRSCSNGSLAHCGHCQECEKRKAAFAEASIPDPSEYDNALALPSSSTR